MVCGRGLRGLKFVRILFLFAWIIVTVSSVELVPVVLKLLIKYLRLCLVLQLNLYTTQEILPKI